MQSAVRDNIKLGKTPIFESTDYSSFKKLEKEVKKVAYFDKGVFRQGTDPKEISSIEVSSWQTSL